MLVLILLLLLLLLSMFLSLRKSSPSIRQQRLPLFLQHRRTARFVEDRPTCVCRTLLSVQGEPDDTSPPNPNPNSFPARY